VCVTTTILRILTPLTLLAAPLAARGVGVVLAHGQRAGEQHVGGRGDALHVGVAGVPAAAAQRLVREGPL